MSFLNVDVMVTDPGHRRSVERLHSWFSDVRHGGRVTSRDPFRVRWLERGTVPGPPGHWVDAAVGGEVVR